MRIVQSRTNRLTGTRIEVIDNRDGSFEDGCLPGEGGWVTLCDDHGNYCLHDTRTLAEWFAPTPTDWCESCADLQAQRIIDAAKFLRRG